MCGQSVAAYGTTLIDREGVSLSFRALPHVRRARSLVFFAVVVALLAFAAAPSSAGGIGAPPKVKPTTATGPGTFQIPSGPSTRLNPNGATALGFCGGDDWEPDIATSGTYVYVVWSHYVGDPTCDPASANPHRIYIRVSSDSGQTFGPLHVISDTVDSVTYADQVDCVVTVDPVTGAVHVSFLAYGNQGVKTDVAVATSTDHGSTFIAHKVNVGCSNCDHPWTLAYGNDVYTAYDSAKNHYIALSKDGGQTWTEALVDQTDVVAFAEGGVLDAQHNAIFAWGDCLRSSCGGNIAGDYRISKTLAGTLSTTFTHVAYAPAGPDCPYSPSCGFAFFGVQDDIGIDDAGTLYVAWQDGEDHTKAGSPSIVQLSKSTDGGTTWQYVGRLDDKTASGCATACYALFPRIEGSTAGHIDAMWMDDRLGAPLDHKNGWNVWLRSSSDGGTSWGASQRVSSYDRTRTESRRNGFLFPYGDYEDIKIVGSTAYMMWGEGHDYTGGPSNPGHVVYRSMAA